MILSKHLNEILTNIGQVIEYLISVNNKYGKNNMMNILEFMTTNPWLTFFLALILLGIIESIGKYLINRPLRHRNIRLHGYPPPHCDADGDFKEDDDKE